MELARGREYEVFDRSIDVQISRLRKLVEDDPAQPRYIQTVWGFGYVFVPDGSRRRRPGSSRRQRPSGSMRLLPRTLLWRTFLLVAPADAAVGRWPGSPSMPSIRARAARHADGADGGERGQSHPRRAGDRRSRTSAATCCWICPSAKASASTRPRTTTSWRRCRTIRSYRLIDDEVQRQLGPEHAPHARSQRHERVLGQLPASTTTTTG